MKIRIFGGPGSGKTYISKKISEKYNIPHIETDNIRWKSKYSYTKARNNEEKEKILNDTLKKNKQWIIDGTTASDWSWKTFKTADKIIILKPNLKKDIERIIKRSTKRILRIDKNQRKETIKGFIGLIKWAKLFKKEVYPNTIKKLKQQKIRHKIFNTPSEAEKYLEKIMKK